MTQGVGDGVVVPGPNAGETIHVWRQDGRFWVQRTLPRLGRMQKAQTGVPWQFAYDPESARVILDFVASVSE